MPSREGKTLQGWGVVRCEPWHFVGIYGTRAEAESEARQRGDDYIVCVDEGREDTGDLIGQSPERLEADRT
jgi:hypothetical protein